MVIFRYNCSLSTVSDCGSVLADVSCRCGYAIVSGFYWLFRFDQGFCFFSIVHVFRLLQF